MEINISVSRTMLITQCLQNTENLVKESKKHRLRLFILSTGVQILLKFEKQAVSTPNA